jgi:hypothetical protein
VKAFVSWRSNAMLRQNLALGLLGKSHVLAPLAQRTRLLPPPPSKATTYTECVKMGD